MQIWRFILIFMMNITILYDLTVNQTASSRSLASTIFFFNRCTQIRLSSTFADLTATFDTQIQIYRYTVLYCEGALECTQIG